MQVHRLQKCSLNACFGNEGQTERLHLWRKRLQRSLVGLFQVPQAAKNFQNARFGNEIAASEAGAAKTWWVVPDGESARIARPPARPPLLQICAAAAVFWGSIRCAWTSKSEGQEF